MVRQFVPSYLNSLQKELNQMSADIKKYVCRLNSQANPETEEQADKILQALIQEFPEKKDKSPEFYFLKNEPLHQLIMRGKMLSEAGYEKLNEDGSFSLQFPCPICQQEQAQYFLFQMMCHDIWNCLVFCPVNRLL